MVTVQRETVRIFSLEFACVELLITIRGQNVTLTIPWHGTEHIVSESNTDTVFSVEFENESTLFRWAIAVYSEWIVKQCNEAVRDVSLNHNRPVDNKMKLPF